jgi:hypothetical protein
MTEEILDSIHDDLEAYALGALDRDEERRFALHLATCEPCRDGLASYVPVTNALRSIPAVVPPPAPAVGTPDRQVIPLRRRFAPAAFAYAAAAAVLLLLGAGLYSVTQPKTDSQLMAVAGMMADGPRQALILGDGVRGRIIIGRRNLRAAVVLRGLPAPPRGSAYHVWRVDAQAPVLVGALSPARDNIEVLLTDTSSLAGGHALRVSLEAVDAHAPSGAPVATGTY